MLGKTLWELVSSFRAVINGATHKSVVAAQWSFRDFECAVALSDGQLATIALAVSPFTMSSGVFTGFQGTGLDITERKRAEIALPTAASH